MRRRRAAKGAHKGKPGQGSAVASVSDIRERRKRHLIGKEESVKELGDRAFAERNFEKAVEHYTLAMKNEKRKKSLAVLHSNRSAAHCALEKFGKALNDAKAAVTADPTWPKAYFRLGYAVEKTSEFKEALEHYEKGLGLCSSQPQQFASPGSRKKGDKKRGDDPNGKDKRGSRIPTISDKVLLQDAVARVKAKCKLLKLETRIEADEKDPFYRMVRWLKEGGAKFPHLYMRRYRSNHRGVHAMGNLAPQTQILYVPLKFIMTSEMARASAVCKAMTASKVSVDSSHTWLAAYLLQERDRKEKSFFHPYISILPKEFPTIPLFFGKEFLDMLEGSFSLDKIDRRNKHLHEEYDRIAAKVPEFARFKYEDFVWARLVVITRIFGINVKKQKTDGLVPYADMLNHKLPRETTWCYVDDREGFVINTVKPIGIGDEVFDSYGRKCNHRFFVNYGFTLEKNEDNEAVMRLKLDKKDPLAKRKATILSVFVHHPYEEMEFQVPPRYGEQTPEMLGFCRMCAMTESELNTFVKKRGGVRNILAAALAPSNGQNGKGNHEPAKKFSMENIEPISAANERKALEMIREAAKVALKRFPTTVEHDEALLKKDDFKSINHRNCVVMRLGEKKVLNWWLSACARADEMLRMSFLRFRSRIKSIMYEDLDFDTYAEGVLEPLVKANTIF